jgi:hypothetical protein
MDYCMDYCRRKAKKIGVICILFFFFMLLNSFHPDKGFTIIDYAFIGTSSNISD